MALHVFQVEALANALRSELSGKSLSCSFSTSSTEFFLDFQGLVYKISFYKGEFFIQQIEPKFLPKKNRLNLFEDATSCEVLELVAYPLDRLFRLELSGGYSLVFYAFGKFSQVGLYHNAKYVQHFPARRNVIPEPPKNSSIQIKTREDVLEQLPWLKDVFPTILNSDEDFSSVWRSFYLKQLKGPWFINKKGEKYLLETEAKDHIGVYEHFLDAISDFSRLHIGSSKFFEEKRNILTSIDKDISLITKRIKSVERKIEQISSGTGYKMKGDLIMANLHFIKGGSKEVKLPSFDTGEDVVIKLNTALSPAKNAERFYRKSKKESLQLNMLNDQLEELKGKLKQLEEDKSVLENVDQFKDLKPWIKEVKKETKVRLPYTSMIIDGYELRIGRSAKDNDELLRRYSSSNDLWFHAKGVSGSHVILRKPNSRSQFPTSIIERVAAIAAYHSKAKNEELARVIYTEKKYVRKPKGAHPGQVFVERETSVLVRPER